MKSLIQAIAIAAALTVPAVSFAQSDAPETRAQVKADLSQFDQAQQAGGHVSGRDPYYPASTQAAEARVSQGNGTNSYGGVVGSSAASGKLTRVVNPSDQGTIYFGR
jgi:hypothetical protein